MKSDTYHKLEGLLRKLRKHQQKFSVKKQALKPAPVQIKCLKGYYKHPILSSLSIKGG
jgi:hypothetical protein